MGIVREQDAVEVTTRPAARKVDISLRADINGEYNQLFHEVECFIGRACKRNFRVGSKERSRPLLEFID